MVWAALAGPLIGVAAVGWVRLIARADALPARGAGTPACAAGRVRRCWGVLSIHYPQLLGNGKGIVQLARSRAASRSACPRVLLVLKPLATAACLGAGAPGGLFTPTLTIGVLLTGVLAGLWSHIWPHTVRPATP